VIFAVLDQWCITINVGKKFHPCIVAVTLSVVCLDEEVAWTESSCMLRVTVCCFTVRRVLNDEPYEPLDDDDDAGPVDTHSSITKPTPVNQVNLLSQE